MRGTLIKHVDSWADENRILLPETAIVVGISGGADSVCLLHVFTQLQQARGFTMTAVHINHMLREHESMGDEDFVRKLCSQWQIPLTVFREDVQYFSKQQGCSIEEAGRNIRYQRFEQVRQETDAQFIAVAHHSGDQAETIFLNMLRGSGLDGLCGMDCISGVILRPLLSVSREQIEAHLREHGIGYREDSSNLTDCYTRNRIRNTLFPKIQKETRFPLPRALNRMAHLLQADRDYLNDEAMKQYQQLIISEQQHRVILDRSALNTLYPAISSRVIRIAWEKLTRSLKGLEAKHVEAVLNAASRGGTGKTIELPQSVIAITEYSRLIISKKFEPEPARVFTYKLDIPGVLDLPKEHLRVSTRLYTRDEYLKSFQKLEKPNEKSLTQFFDYTRLNTGINIRNRLPGDVFFPYRGPGRKKLKDFLIDEKIPKGQRDKLPLIATGGNILWVIGFRTADDYKVTKDTQIILCVEITSKKLLGAVE